MGAGQSYTPTSSSHDTGDSVLVSYGSGNFSGEEWTDTVTLGDGLFISQQSIGVAASSSGVGNLDGILGLGPAVLTDGTVSNEGVIPTVVDNLFSQVRFDLFK